MDECANALDDCDKTGFSICTNKNGSYECSCRAGNFSGSGTNSNPCIGKEAFQNSFLESIGINNAGFACM